MYSETVCLYNSWGQPLSCQPAQLAPRKCKTSHALLSEAGSVARHAGAIHTRPACALSSKGTENGVERSACSFHAVGVGGMEGDGGDSGGEGGGEGGEGG